MFTSHIVEEKKVRKVEAIFAARQEAEQAVKYLISETGIPLQHVQVIDGADPSYEKKLEPEPQLIRRTLWRTHGVLGLAGIILGLLLGLGLAIAGVGAVVANPALAIATLAFFGAMLGLIAAGVMSLKPQHDAVNMDAVQNLNEGKVLVLVMAEASEEAKRAKACLKPLAQKVNGEV